VSFDQQLRLGRIGERLVSEWAKGRGWFVVPSYEFSGANGDKAPRMQGSAASYVIPDLDVARQGLRLWLEVKTYDYSPINKALGAQVHGLKRRLHENYLAVQEHTGSPVHVGVLEISTGELLIGRLDSMEAHPCMCRSCQRGRPGSCAAPVGDSVYFRRDAFKHVHTFGDDAMRPLREARDEIRAGRSVAVGVGA
jgi:hypothetical protein